MTKTGAKPIEMLTLEEVLAMPLYKVELLDILKNLMDSREALLRKYNGAVKRNALDRLSDKGLLNTESIITLYPQVLAKVARNLSSLERQAITQLGDMALHNTYVLLKKEQDEQDNGGQAAE